jgi:hypothetical protein
LSDLFVEAPTIDAEYFLQIALNNADQPCARVVTHKLKATLTFEKRIPSRTRDVIQIVPEYQARQDSPENP